MKLLNFYDKYRDSIFIKPFLISISWGYFIAYSFWISLYKLNILRAYKLSCPVISIGNITTGGTGKTPVTIEIANYFISKGFKVAILSRGYKKKSGFNSSGNILVSDGEDILGDALTSGDEPYLMAKKVPKAIVIVNSNRVHAGLTAIKLGANIILLDDGFQHLKLHRDENILVIDSNNPFDNGHLLPAGKLREPKSAIYRSTSIILNDSNPLNKETNGLEQYSKIKPAAKIKYSIKHLKGINIKRVAIVDEIKDSNVLLFCGIASPKRFTKIIKEMGLKIFDTVIFEDHHSYKINDIKSLINLALAQKIENLITTEKDAVKINELCESAPVTFWSAPLELSWDSNNPFERILTKNIYKLKTE